MFLDPHIFKNGKLLNYGAEGCWFSALGIKIFYQFPNLSHFINLDPMIEEASAYSEGLSMPQESTINFPLLPRDAPKAFNQGQNSDPVDCMI